MPALFTKPPSSPLRANFPPPYMSPRRPRSSTALSSTMVTPTSSGLQPYLGLRARVSLAWLAYPILVLLLVLIQLFLTLQSIQDGVSDAKQRLLASCSGVEGAASVAVSIPHFMAEQTNDALVIGAERIVHGLAVVLDISIRAIEAIVLYIIDTYRSLYLCLAEFVVRASLALLIAAAEEAEKVFAEAVNGIRTAIQSTIGAAESVFNGAINDLNKLPLVHIQPPKLDIPDLGALQNVKVPTGLSDALIKLNTTLPTLAELRDSLDKLVTTPFEAMRLEVTDKLSKATIDRNLLQIPPQKTVKFCQNLDTSFIDEIGKILSSGIKLIILAILIVIIIITLCNMLKEWFLWKRRLIHLQRSRNAWLSSSVHSLSSPKLLSFLQSMQNPLVSRLTNRFSAKGASSHRVPWLLAYLTWPSALMFLGAGLLGLLVVEGQLAALDRLRNRAVQQANSGVTDLTQLVANRINQETGNSSAAFANSTNTVILRFQNDVNDHMLGWAGTTTTTLNNTLVSFYDGLTRAVSATFDNTPLRNPALELLNCLLGSKVAGIEKALTFIHDNAHVELPTVSPTVLMITPRQTQDLVSSFNSESPQISPDAEAGADQTPATRYVDKLIDRYVKALHKQRVTYLLILGCYLVVIIFSLIGIAWDIIRRRRSGGTQDNSQPKAMDEKPQASDAPITQSGLKGKGRNEIRLPTPSLPKLFRPSHPSPSPPKFSDIANKIHLVSKFSPITPSPSSGSKWPAGKAKP
ncbi:hypothetical protein O181_052430 [Austropuccinia psidii MF-1]|uniref:Plasma membrane fusion protein PRM1 n=1 Tax=Austropuccinia psidii MF-1 TaxID=1389203 RepID=A0A9Q3DYV0_9BASI|nr:hypothetical protein [Austropuccinia psidii MF-1]